jgi:energy-coupling factor transporter ATP-binding protein EcfA2
VLLLGASGSGKSTLLAGLAGVLGGDDDGEARGRLLIDGVPATAARGRVGLVLQDPETQVLMARVGDDVAFGCENLGVPRDEIWRRVDDVLDAVGLRMPRDHPSERLSGGQKQRLALAGVIAMRPGLILLDEPTANLDPDGVQEVVEAVAALAASTGSTVIVVEHRVAAWRHFAGRVVVLGPGGSIIADGNPDAVLEREGAALAAMGVWVPGREPRARFEAPELGAALLTAEGLAVSREPGRVILGELDFAIAERQAVAVSGPNGVGKSTLALTVAGLIAPTAGVLRAEPTLASGLGPHAIRWKSRDLLPRIGVVFQSPEHQFLASTVRGELAVGPRALKMSPTAVAERVDELLGRLGLTALADAHPFTLSGGQQRRLSVGTALAASPRLLVLDEPTFGQDAVTWLALVRLFAEVRDAGTALLMVTHDELLAPSLDATPWELGRRAA